MSDPSVSSLGAVITDPRVRRAVYSAFVVAGVLALAINSAYGVIGHPPTWVAVMNAVLASLTTPLGTLAVANMRVPRKAESRR